MHGLKALKVMLLCGCARLCQSFAESCLRASPLGVDVQSDGLHFLFVGNSFTSVNNLPGMFAKMAVAGGYRADAYFSGFGSATFRTHYLNPNLPLYVNMFKWDAIVMQEQSMFLSQAPSVYKQNSVPWAIKLYDLWSTRREASYDLWSTRREASYDLWSTRREASYNNNATTKVLLYETWVIRMAIHRR